MPAPGPSATVRARRLGKELERLRIKAGLKPAEAGKRLGWDHNKVRRHELAQVELKKGDFERYLNVYGPSDADRDLLLKLYRNAWRLGWWIPYGDVLSGNFAVLEDEASKIWSSQNQFVPGLLQIEPYARAIIRAALPDIDETALDRRVEGRMKRREMLNRDENAPQLHAILGEAVLRQQVGGPDVMRAQLAHLLRAATEKPNVTIQVVPFTANAHPGLEGPFVIFDFPEDGDAVAHTEGRGGEHYAETLGDVDRFRLAWDGVASAALSEEESAAMLAARA